jgi:hypothetical protein
MFDQTKSIYDHAMTLQEATDHLRDIYKEFPFGDWRQDEQGVWQSRSLAVQIAAMLSQFCVHILPKGANRMGFIYNANSQRSGKTLLAKMALCPVHGGMAAQTWKSSEEEITKVVDAQLLEAKTYICFDNCKGFLQSPTIEALMTSPQWTGRILGQTRTFTVNNSVTVFITGNDCTVSSDISYRCLLVNLFVADAEVQDRETSVIIDEPWLLDRANRIKMLSCLAVIVRHWVEVAGRPTASSFGYKPLLGFEAWGNVIGGIVAAAGFGNCLERASIATAGDNEKRDITTLVRLMSEFSFGGGTRLEFRFDELVKICFDEELFPWAMDGKEKDDTMVLSSEGRSRLGKLFSRYAPDMASGGRRFTFGENIYLLSTRGTGRSRRYVLEKTTAFGVDLNK